MDDLISRQAAIDAVQNRHMMLNKEKVLLINDLEKLPSAQPDIVRCKDCLYRKICSWEKQGAKFCSFAEKREVTE